LVLRQHARLHRAVRPLLHDGRQPRQLDRQPRAEPGRIRADRQHRRPRRDHLLLGGRRRGRLEGVALALGRALGPAVHDRSMSRKAKNTIAREELEQRIGYTFADKLILDRALTHISAASPKLGRGGSYQRLEFLGDHVLGLAVSDMLYRAFPKGDEGELSRRLADLVRRESCADVARAIDLGAALRLGSSESNAGGRRRMATLADVCEALIGAVFVDGGY